MKSHFASALFMGYNIESIPILTLVMAPLSLLEIRVKFEIPFISFTFFPIFLTSYLRIISKSSFKDFCYFFRQVNPLWDSGSIIPFFLFGKRELALGKASRKVFWSLFVFPMSSCSSYWTWSFLHQVHEFSPEPFSLLSLLDWFILRREDWFDFSVEVV